MLSSARSSKKCCIFFTSVNISTHADIIQGFSVSVTVTVAVHACWVSRLCSYNILNAITLMIKCNTTNQHIFVKTRLPIVCFSNQSFKSHSKYLEALKPAFIKSIIIIRTKYFREDLFSLFLRLLASPIKCNFFSTVSLNYVSPDCFSLGNNRRYKLEDMDTPAF